MCDYYIILERGSVGDQWVKKHSRSVSSPQNIHLIGASVVEENIMSINRHWPKFEVRETKIWLILQNGDMWFKKNGTKPYVAYERIQIWKKNE